MKKILASFVVSSVLGVSGSLLLAQEASPTNPAQTDSQIQPQHGPRVIDPSVQAQHLTKRLKLNSEQQTQVLNILSAQRDQVTSLRSDTSLSQADRRSKLQGVRADSESKIRALLNDDQKQAFGQMQQQRMEHQRNRKG